MSRYGKKTEPRNLIEIPDSTYTKILMDVDLLKIELK
jgi:hypothetical protein